MSNLINILCERAQKTPNEDYLIYLRDGENDEIRMSYGELHKRASAVAKSLIQAGAQGKTVLILHDTDIEYIVSFYGCLYAKAIAVPAYPVMKKKHTPRLQAIISDCAAGFALASRPVISKMSEFELNLNYIASEECQDASGFTLSSYGPDEIAFLQYTSGSTSDPKGVMVSHGNIIANSKAVNFAGKYREGSVLVSWLPLFHDMGIITGPVQAMYAGHPFVYMAPGQFLQKPLRWLQAISKYKGTCSGGPTFAYDLCNARISADDVQGLDLSSWEVAFISAEPVKDNTLRRFHKKFAHTGFRSQAYLPCYGLAEATLIVSSTEKLHPYAVKKIERTALEAGRGTEIKADITQQKFYEMVSSGKGFADHTLITVNPDTFEVCDDSQVGEIWLSGPSVAKGYWNRADVTEATFHAKIKTASGHPQLEGLHFLRTGDLGFLSGEQLYVTGRLKDLIIIRGRNIYPQDVEATINKVSQSLRMGRGAAFSAEFDGEEKLVIVQEVVDGIEIDGAELNKKIAAAIAEEFEVKVHAISLIKSDELPITSSGKVKRRASRDKFLKNQLQVVASWKDEAAASPAPSSKAVNVTDRCRAIVAAQLKLDIAEIDYMKGLSQYGMDSLTALNISHEIQTEFKLEVPVSFFLNDATLLQLILLIEKSRAKAS